MQPDPDTANTARAGANAAEAPSGPPYSLDGPGDILLARLVKNSPMSVEHPSEYCLEDKQLYRGSEFRAGDLNLFGATGELKRDWGGAPVLLFGSLKRPLMSVVTKVGPCPADYENIPIPQMRSDWGSPECGQNLGHSTRATLEGLDYFEVSAARSLELIEFVARDAEHLTIRLKNPFDRPLEAKEGGPLQATVHYEGLYGKPGARDRPLELSIPAGGSQELVLDRIFEGGPRPGPGLKVDRKNRRHALYNLELNGQLGSARVELTLRLVELGS